MAAIAFCLAAAGIFWFAERQARQMEFGFGNFQDRAFELVDQTGASPRQCRFRRRADRAVLRLHLLPRRLPDDIDAAVDVAGRGGGTGHRHNAASDRLHDRRCRTRHAGTAGGLSVAVRPAGDRPDRDRRQLARAHDAFGAYASRVEDSDGVVLFDHTATVYLYDAGGTFTGTLAFNEPPEFVTEKLRRLF